MTFQDEARKIVTTFAGLAMAVFFGFLLFEHRKDVSVTHTAIFSLMMCIGMGMFSNDVFWNQLKKLVGLAVEARRGGVIPGKEGDK